MQYKKVNGRKRHIAVDAGGLLLEVLASAACTQDRDAARCCGTCVVPASTSAWPGPTAATPAGWFPGQPRRWT